MAVKLGATRDMLGSSAARPRSGGLTPRWGLTDTFPAMTDHFNLEAARERYKTEPDELLIRIAFSPETTYRPEAIRLARDELAARGIEREDHASIIETRAVIEAEKVANLGRQAAPLGAGYKVICFVLADLVAIVIAIAHLAAGRKRACVDAFKWMGFGWLVRIAVVAFFLVTSPP